MTLFIFTSKNFLNEFDMEQLAPIFCIEVDNNTQYINLDNLNDVMLNENKIIKGGI